MPWRRRRGKVAIGVTGLIPNRFLFDFEFPLRYRAAIPTMDGRLAGWSDEERLPNFGSLDGRPSFADVWACWSETGLALAVRVAGKRRALQCDAKKYWTGDNIRLCTDMRDARSNKRATRFCQQFFFLPTGGGGRRTQPVAGVGQFQRARENAPSVPAERIQVTSAINPGGYALEAFIPAACLSGFDPVEHGRIGFYYIVEDRERGSQYLTVGDDLYWNVDPSTWATAVLARLATSVRPDAEIPAT